MISYVVSHDTFALSPSGKSAVAAKYSGRMEHIDFVTGKRKTLSVTMCKCPIEVPDNPNESPYHRAILNPYLQFLDERHLLLVGDSNTLVVHNLEKGDSEVLVELEGKPSVFRVHRFAEMIAVAIEKKVYIYSLSGQLLHVLAGCRSAINDLGVFHHSRKVVAVGDKRLHCWDLDARTPKDTPLFTFPNKGIQLSVSECDQYISCTVKAPYYARQLLVIASGTSECVFQDDSSRLKYRSCGGALFSRDKLHIADFGKVSTLSISDWSEMGASERIWFLQTADCANDVMAAGHGGAIHIVDQGKHTFFSQGVENTLPIHTIVSVGDEIYSISEEDCVTRDGRGVGKHRSTFDDQVRRGGDTHGVEECLFEDCLWIPCCYMAAVYDFKEQKTVSRSEYEAHVGTSLRLSSNHLLLARENGFVAVYTDDGEEINSNRGSGKMFRFAWQLNDDEVMLVADEGYFRVALDRLDHSNGAHYLGKIELACHSKATDLVCLDISYGDSRKLIATPSSLTTMESPIWSRDLGNDGYLIGWLIKGESVLEATNNLVKRIDICTGQADEIPGIEIPVHARANCAWSDGKILMIGLSDGRVLTTELTGGAVA